MALVSHIQQQIQENTNNVAEYSARLKRNIHTGKSKTLMVNSTSTASVTLGEESKKVVEHITYLGSVVGTGWDRSIR